MLKKLTINDFEIGDKIKVRSEVKVGDRINGIAFLECDKTMKSQWTEVDNVDFKDNTIRLGVSWIPIHFVGFIMKKDGSVINGATDISIEFIREKDKVLLMKFLKEKDHLDEMTYLSSMDKLIHKEHMIEGINMGTTDCLVAGFYIPRAFIDRVIKPNGMVITRTGIFSNKKVDGFKKEDFDKGDLIVFKNDSGELEEKEVIDTKDDELIVGSGLTISLDRVKEVFKDNNTMLSLNEDNKDVCSMKYLTIPKGFKVDSYDDSKVFLCPELVKNCFYNTERGVIFVDETGYCSRYNVLLNTWEDADPCQKEVSKLSYEEMISFLSNLYKNGTLDYIVEIVKPDTGDVCIYVDPDFSSCTLGFYDPKMMEQDCEYIDNFWILASKVKNNHERDVILEKLREISKNNNGEE